MVATLIDSSKRRSMRLVSQADTGEPMHSMIAPKVMSSPASRIETPNSCESSGNMPAGARMHAPVTKLPSINEVGANRFTPKVVADGEINATA